MKSVCWIPNDVSVGSIALENPTFFFPLRQANPNLMHAFQAAATTGGSGTSGPATSKSLNAAVMGDALPRGRGIDERAARAAAEIRKKAAARGLLVRPNGAPVQGLPPFTQLLNIINSGLARDAVDNKEAEAAKKEANGHLGNGPESSKTEQPAKSGKDGQAPVGLGKGFSSLDGKKQKTKPKAPWSLKLF